MITRLALPVLGSAILIGCGAKDPDVAYTSDHMPYSRSAYQSGHSEAETDLRAGRLIIEDYGFPRKGQAEFAEILRQRYQIALRRVAKPTLSIESHLVTRSATMRYRSQRLNGALAQIYSRRRRQRRQSITMHNRSNKPNQAMQRTASRRAMTISIIKPVPPRFGARFR